MSEGVNSSGLVKAAAHLMETEHGFKHVLHEQLLQTLWREAEQH